MPIDQLKSYCSNFSQRVGVIAQDDLQPNYNVIFIAPIITTIFILFLIPFEINFKYWEFLLKSLLLNSTCSIFLYIFCKKIKSIGLAIFFLFAIFHVIGRFRIGTIISINYLIVFFSLLFFAILYKDGKHVFNSFFEIIISAFLLFIILLQRCELGYAQPFGEINIYKDTLFHTAIAAMIKNYQTVSIGLHGLIPLRYHTGSHTIFAAISKILNIPVYYSYNFSYPLFVIPLMFTSFLCLAEELIPSKKNQIILRSFMLMILIISIRNPIYYKTYFSQIALLSESYTFSIINIIAMISVLLRLERSPKKNQLYFNSIVLLLLFWQTITFKISSPFVFMGFLTAWLFFSNSQNFKLKFTTYLTCLSSYFILFKSYNQSASSMLFKPFHTIQSINLGHDYLNNIFVKTPYFILIQLSFSTIAVLLGVYLYINKKAKNQFPIWMFIGLFLSSLIGVLPSFFYLLPGGAHFFFANVTQILSLPFIILIPSIFTFQNLQHKPNRHLFTNKIFSILFISFFSINLLLGFIPTIPKIHKASQILISGMKKKQTIFDNDQIITLFKIRDQQDSPNKLIYIERSQKDFWNLFNCHTSIFLIPALAEQPGIFSYPDKDCEASDYGVGDYALFRTNKIELTHPHELLLSIASNISPKAIIITIRNKTITKI